MILHRHLQKGVPVQKIVARLSSTVKKQLEKLRRKTRDKALAQRCHIILLDHAGKSRPQIAEAAGCSLSWVKRVIRRFADLGIAGLLDRREDNGERKLDERYLAQLHQIVSESPRDYGHRRPTWTRELLVKVMFKLTGVQVHVGTMSRALAKIGARRGRPRPMVNCPWSKSRRNRRIRMIRRAIENLGPAEMTLYVDEADIHLNPKIGLDWMNQGQQKQALTPGQNQKRYIAGAWNPATGKLDWVLADQKNSLLFIALLQRLLKLYPQKKVIHLVLDNYVIHSSRQTQAFLAEHGSRFRLHFLPPYCPLYNRIERKWQDLHANVTRNHTCKSMAELEEEVVYYLTQGNRAASRTAKAA